jgi:trehalose 6-phosphate synthase/phosphatase
MPLEEQRRRMSSLREKVQRNDVGTWANAFLRALGDTADTKHRVATTPPPATLVDKLLAASRLALFLDYDGTLLELADRPELAVPDPELRELLHALAKRPHTEVHIVSERAPKDLERLLGDLPVRLHAENGFWTRTHEGWRARGDEESRWKPAAITILEAFAERTPGAFVEDKPTSLSWHYRLSDPELASTRIRELRLALFELLRANSIDLVTGAKVLELRRSGVNKGVVVGEAASDATVVAVGDDRNDLDLFAAAERRGFSVHIGSAATPASLRVASPRDLRALLTRLVSEEEHSTDPLAAAPTVAGAPAGSAMSVYAP